MENPAPSALPPTSPARDETARLALFVAGAEDVVGMIAHALHLQALAAFRTRFANEMGRLPSEGDEAAFLIGDTDPVRISWYRSEASRLLAGHSREASPTGAPAAIAKHSFWPRFGMLPEAAQSAGAGQVNWKGLVFRLAILLLAVITTAILLRVLVVGR